MWSALHMYICVNVCETTCGFHFARLLTCRRLRCSDQNVARAPVGSCLSCNLTSNLRSTCSNACWNALLSALLRSKWSGSFQSDSARNSFRLRSALTSNRFVSINFFLSTSSRILCCRRSRCIRFWRRCFSASCCDCSVYTQVYTCAYIYIYIHASHISGRVGGMVSVVDSVLDSVSRVSDVCSDDDSASDSSVRTRVSDTPAQTWVGAQACFLSSCFPAILKINCTSWI